MRHLCRPTGASILLVSLLLIATAGCAFEGEPEPGLETVAIADDCPTWGCNSNSPVVDGSPMHELDEGPAVPAALLPGPMPEGGGFNSWGTRLVRLEKGGVSYRVDVRGDRLRALDGTGAVALEGAALVGSTIVLERMDGSNLYVFIETFNDSLRFWVGRPGRIQTFRLTWSTLPAAPPGQERRKVCKLLADTATWGVAAAHEAIFFQGDRYDGPSKQVIATGKETGGWFNVACAGGTPAKMHANRHTVAGQAPGFDADPLEKQALLKALTADYCGSGTSFTEVDEPLTWQNDGDWKVLTPVASYESVWDSTGALCLDVPRMGDSEDELEETMAAIEDECDLPHCDTLGAFPKGWKDAGYIVTANPL